MSYLRFQNRTCLACGWVHFGVSRQYAEDEVARFNAFYEKAEPKVRAFYSGPSSIKNYEFCKRCGGSWENFRDSRPGDCPDGCTLNPIIYVRAAESRSPAQEP